MKTTTLSQRLPLWNCRFVAHAGHHTGFGDWKTHFCHLFLHSCFRRCPWLCAREMRYQFHSWALINTWL